MTTEDVPLDFIELQHELQEFGGRVIAVEIRSDTGELIAKMEGEYAGVHSDADNPDDVWFEVGSKEPPKIEGVRFIVASSASIHIPEHRFVKARRSWGGIGAFIITIETKTIEDMGLHIHVWPAMPPRKQWTEMHDDDR